MDGIVAGSVKESAWDSLDPIVLRDTQVSITETLSESSDMFVARRVHHAVWSAVYDTVWGAPRVDL